MIKKHLLFALFTGITFVSVAQNTCQQAETYFKSGNYDDAIKYYNMCKMDFPTIDVSQDIENAKQCRDLLGAANDAFDKKEYKKTAEKYSDLLDKNPSDRHASDRKNQCDTKINPYPPLPPNVDTVVIHKSDSIRPTPDKTKTGAKFNFGIKAGLNLSNIFNSTNGMDFSPQLKPDFHAGIFVNMRSGDWGLQPELLYSRAGFKNNGNAVIFNYITVPVLAKLYVQGFNVELGPYVSYLKTVSPRSTVITIDYSKAVEIKLSNLEKGTDFGVAIGIGYEFDFGLTIGARYNQGLSDMAKNLQWKNSVAAISLGFKY